MKWYRLIGPEGQEYASRIPGKLGGHRKLRIYGRLDCPSALRYLAKGQYAQHRVFFLDEDEAKAAGYRPCARCMRREYTEWRRREERRTGIRRA